MRPAVTIALLLSLVASSGASLRKQCNQRCGEEINACVAAHGGKKRAKCKAQVRAQCRHQGIQVCVPPTTTTSTPTTTTTTTLPSSSSCPVALCSTGACCSDPAYPYCALDGGCCPLGYPVSCPDGNGDGIGYCCPPETPVCGRSIFQAEACLPGTTATTTTLPGAATTTTLHFTTTTFFVTTTTTSTTLPSPFAQLTVDQYRSVTCDGNPAVQVFVTLCAGNGATGLNLNPFTWTFNQGPLSYDHSLCQYDEVHNPNACSSEVTMNSPGCFSCSIVFDAAINDQPRTITYDTYGGPGFIHYVVTTGF